MASRCAEARSVADFTSPGQSAAKLCFPHYFSHVPTTGLILTIKFDIRIVRRY